MANTAKSTHYSNQFFVLLEQGPWTDAAPASSAKLEKVSWSEIVRKGSKYGGLEAGKLVQDLLSVSLALLPNPISIDSTSQQQSSSSISQLDGDSQSLTLADHWDRVSIQAEHSAELESCLKSVSDILSKYQGTSEKGDVGKTACLLLKSYILHAQGKLAESLAILEGSVNWAVVEGSKKSKETGEPKENVWDKAWGLGVAGIRGKVLQGIAYELIGSQNNTATSSALQSYREAIYLAHLLYPVSSASPNSSKSNTTPNFTQHREVARWIERAAFRGSIISSSDSSLSKDSWWWVQTYVSLSISSWAPTFRSERKKVIWILYLTLLEKYHKTIFCSEVTATAVSANGLNGSSSQNQHLPTSNSWVILPPTLSVPPALTLQSHLLPLLPHILNQTILSSPFPQASSSSPFLPTLVNTLLTLWTHTKESLPLAKALEKLFLRAIERSYHSRPIMRGLIRVTSRRGEMEAPAKWVKTYVSIESKARETHSVEGMETDATWTKTLLLGAKVLAGVGEWNEAVKLANLAKEVGVEAFRGEVEGALGILYGGMSEKDQSVSDRPGLQQESLSHLMKGVALLPKSPSLHYALAYQEASSLLIDEAITSVKSALELDPGMVRGWHLLGLLLTAKGDWSGAKEILEVGLEAWDDTVLDQDKETLPAIATGSGSLADNGVLIKDFATTKIAHNDHSSSPSAEILDIAPSFPSSAAFTTSLEIFKYFSSTQISSSLSTAIETSIIYPLLTPPERLEEILQLRMTRNVLIERLEGPEVALTEHEDLFHFFSERVGSAIVLTSSVGEMSARGSSLDSPRLTSTTLAISNGAAITPVNGSEVAGTASAEDIVEVLVDVVPPSPEPGLVPQQSLLTRARSNTPSLTFPLKGGPSNSGDGISVRSLGGGRKQQQDSTQGSSVGKKARFLPKHIHVGKGQPGGRSLSVGPHNKLGGFENGLHVNGSRTISNASSIHSRQSRAVSPANSLYKGADSSFSKSTTMSPPPPAPETAAEASSRTPRETRLLSDLWLMSAATFRRMGRLEQARVAIQEAENMDISNPEVWVQLGLLLTIEGSPQEAQTAFSKALLFDGTHAGALVYLARHYLGSPSTIGLAHGILNSFTQGFGWNVPEAWFYLAQVCKAQGGREERERECLMFALKMEESRTARSVKTALVRWS